MKLTTIRSAIALTAVAAMMFGVSACGSSSSAKTPMIRPLNFGIPIRSIRMGINGTLM